MQKRSEIPRFQSFSLVIHILPTRCPHSISSALLDSLLWCSSIKEIFSLWSCPESIFFSITCLTCDFRPSENFKVWTLNWWLWFPALLSSLPQKDRELWSDLFLGLGVSFNQNHRYYQRLSNQFKPFTNPKKWALIPWRNSLWWFTNTWGDLFWKWYNAI